MKFEGGGRGHPGEVLRSETEVSQVRFKGVEQRLAL